MADDDVKFEKSAPPITAEIRTSGGKDVSSADAVIPAGTKQGEANAANAGSRGMELPDKGRAEEANAKPADIEKEAGKSLIARALAALGLSQEEKDHAKTDLEAKATGTGGKAPVMNDVVATAEKVSGNIGNIDPALLAAASKGLRDSGAVMAEANSAQYQAGAAKQQTKDAGVVPA